jgi:hypothetical protein
VAKALDQMSRAELMERVRQLQAGDTEQALRRTILELEVFREEVRQQNEELIAARNDLEWSRNRYLELYDSAPVGYVTLDANGVVEEINLTGARMLGQDVPRLVGRPFLFSVREPEAFFAHLTRCRQSDGDVVSEIVLRRTDGGSLPVEVRSRAVTNAGRPLYRTTLSDLSERRQLEAERRSLELRAQVAREANEAKDRLLAVLSHELRNPLAAISAGVNLLGETKGLPESLAAAVERIRRNVAAEARLINDLLDASRLRHGKLRIERRPVDLHVVLEDAVEALRSETPELAPELALEATQSVVQGDATRLAQVAANLLRNARHATAQGGRIRVATADGPDARVVLSVADTGCGIEAADLARIFDPFESGRANGGEGGLGLGLGLAISRSLVEAHGGEIRAHSDGPGCGAAFEVELPVLAAERRVPAAPRADEARATMLSSLRILLVDDHRDTAESLALLLRQRGFDVVVAHTVASALEQARNGFDVLISDLGLPDGNGRDLVERLAARGPLRAIALSGYGTEADVAASRAAGFEAHLVKPVEPARLLRVIERVAAA